MKRNFNKFVLVLVLLLTLTCLFACNKKEPNNMEKVLACNTSECKSATVVTTILYLETEIYKETAVYTLDGTTYKKVVDSEELVGLDTVTDGKKHSESTVEKIYSLELKEEYFTDVNNDGITLNAKLNETGAKTLIGENASEATISVKTESGKIASIEINYNMNGQNIKVIANYQY